MIKYIGLHLKSEMQYKMSFALSFTAQFLLFFTYYFVIMSLFNKFNGLKDYTLAELLFCFAVIQIGYSMAAFLLIGFDQFDNLIKSGGFDRLLIRPENIYTQIMGSNIPFARLGKVIQSIVILLIAIFMLEVDWTILKALTTILMILGSFSIFAGIIILGASLCFFTIEGLEVRNVFTDGGRETAQYPIDIYPRQFKLFFTFIIPYALVNYYPLLYIIGRSNNYLYSILPLVAIMFIILPIFIFNYCLRFYKSSGS